MKLSKTKIKEKSSTEETKEKIKSIDKVGNVIFIAIFIIITFAVGSVAFQIFSGTTPSMFGYRMHYILTESMTPTLQVDDVIISKVVGERVEINELQVGDIITFIGEYGDIKGVTVTHRIVKAPYFSESLQKQVVLTKGDKEGAKIDDPVPVENIMGVMAVNAKLLGSIYQFVTSTIGMILVIGIPLVVVFVILIVRLVKVILVPVKEELDKEIAMSEEEKIAEIKAKAIEELLQQQKENQEVESKIVKNENISEEKDSEETTEQEEV